MVRLNRKAKRGDCSPENYIKCPKAQEVTSIVVVVPKKNKNDNKKRNITAMKNHDEV